MTLGEFLKKHDISNHGLIEHRLIDHEDYDVWKDSEHFPGYSGEYQVENNNLKIVSNFDGDIQTISLDTEGVEDTLDNIGGFTYVSHNERVKLAFSE